MVHHPQMFLQFLDFTFWKNRPKTIIGMLVLCILLGISIWIIDISTKLGVAVGVLYVFVVLIGSTFPHRNAPILAAAITSGLVIVGGILSPRGGEIWLIIINRLLTLLVI